MIEDEDYSPMPELRVKRRRTTTVLSEFDRTESFKLLVTDDAVPSIIRTTPGICICYGRFLRLLEGWEQWGQPVTNQVMHKYMYFDGAAGVVISHFYCHQQR